MITEEQEMAYNKQIQTLNKMLADLADENRKLREQLSDCMSDFDVDVSINITRHVAAVNHEHAIQKVVESLVEDFGVEETDIEISCVTGPG